MMPACHADGCERVSRYVLDLEDADRTQVALVGGKGAHLGEISLLSNSLTSARVTASTLVRGLRISREDFERYLETHQQAALRIYRLFSESLAQRVRELSL